LKVETGLKSTGVASRQHPDRARRTQVDRSSVKLSYSSWP
jgi:hypothetical protein